MARCTPRYQSEWTCELDGLRMWIRRIPSQYSFYAVQKMRAEERVRSQKAASMRTTFNSTPVPNNNGSSSSSLQQPKNLQHPQTFMPQPRSPPPPPGFGAIAFSSSQQPLASPSFEPHSSATSSGMPPVVNISNSNSIMRPTVQYQRYHQAESNNSTANGFTPQLGTVPPAQTFHDFPSRSAPISQHMPSQRLESMQPQQHFTTQEQNLSPPSPPTPPSNSCPSSSSSSSTATPSAAPRPYISVYGAQKAFKDRCKGMRRKKKKTTQPTKMEKKIKEDSFTQRIAEERKKMEERERQRGRRN